MKRYGDFPARYEGGKALCKWCGEVVPKGRIYFCTQECAFEVQIRRDSAFLRAQVKKRDHGVCAECKADTEKIKRVLGHARKSLAELLGQDPMWANHYWFYREIKAVVRAIGWKEIGTQWEADHIVEVTKGGEPYLHNIQTLCVPCHKAKTKRQHAERARERKERKQPSHVENRESCCRDNLRA